MWLDNMSYELVLAEVLGTDSAWLYGATYFLNMQNDDSLASSEGLFIFWPYRPALVENGCQFVFCDVLLRTKWRLLHVSNQLATVVFEVRLSAAFNKSWGGTQSVFVNTDSLKSS